MGVPARGPHLLQGEADGLALLGGQDGLVLGIGEGDPHQAVPLLEPYGDEARLAQVLVLLEGGALDEAPLGGEDQVAFLVQAPHGEEGRHLLVLGEGEEAFHVDAPGLAAHLGKLVDLEAVDAAPVREEEEVVVGVGHEDVGGLVFLLGPARQKALPPRPWAR